jgi:hypothetical protein
MVTGGLAPVQKNAKKTERDFPHQSSRYTKGERVGGFTASMKTQQKIQLPSPKSFIYNLTQREERHLKGIPS